MKKFLIKTLILFLVFSSGFFYKKTDVRGLPTDIANAIWNVFFQQVEVIGNRMIGEVDQRLGQLRDLEDELLDDGEFDLQWFIDFDDWEGLGPGFDPETMDISEFIMLNFSDNPGVLDFMDQLEINLLRLRNAGFFDSIEDAHGMSEDEFKRLILLAFLNMINTSSAINPTTGEVFGIEEGIEIEFTPRYPRPGDLININIRPYGFDLANAEIVWWNRGSVIHSGRGATFLNEFQLNNSGLPESFLITIRKENGNVIEREVVVHPADIDIIFEANTFIPPFYRGKAQYTHTSLVKFIAIPTIRDQNGRIMDSSEFRYRWYINNIIVPSNQTVGRNFVYYEDDFSTRDLRVSVHIEGVNSDFVTVRNRTIRPEDPVIVLYEESPLLGPIFERGILSDVSTASREITIRAVPFYFSRNERINIDWSLGGRRLEGFNDQITTFRAPDTDRLSSNISVMIRGARKVTQSASRIFNLVVND